MDNNKIEWETITQFIKRNAQETGEEPLTSAMVKLLINKGGNNGGINAKKVGSIWLIPITDPPTIYRRERSTDGIDQERKKANQKKRSERKKEATRIRKLT
jgi:hypothetical protein